MSGPLGGGGFFLTHTVRTNKPCIQADKLVQSEGYSWHLVLVNQNSVVSEMQPRAVVLCGKSMASEA